MSLFESEDLVPATARKLIVEADGGSRGNPGHAGYGALVRDPDTGKILAEDYKYLGTVSNNVAEYSGLIAGLNLAKGIDPKARVLVRMDSKLVVEQMTGNWKIKHADMRELAQQARGTYPPHLVGYEWIPREKNKDADRLSNVAMDEGMGKPAKLARVGESGKQGSSRTPRLHHIELWCRDLDAEKPSFSWLLGELGFTQGRTWSNGIEYRAPDFYLVLEAGGDVRDEAYDRRRTGMNHVAFAVPTRADVDAIAKAAPEHGWTLMFADTHPYAGGAEHYAAYLENETGFEVEIVASES